MMVAFRFREPRLVQSILSPLSISDPSGDQPTHEMTNKLQRT